MLFHDPDFCTVTPVTHLI